MLGNLYQVLFYYTTALLIGSIETKRFFIFRLGYLLNLLPFFIFCIQWGQKSFEALRDFFVCFKGSRCWYAYFVWRIESVFPMLPKCREPHPWTPLQGTLRGRAALYVILGRIILSNSQIRPIWGVCPFKGTTENILNVIFVC